MGELQIAYMKRVRWEARVHAVEMGKVLAELLRGGDRPDGRTTSGERRGDAGKGQRVSGADLLGEMGVRVKPKAAS